MNAPRKTWRKLDGVLLLDKPQGMTSNTALQKARRLFSAEKAGHTGTLDPMATGLLPVLFGEATKFSNRLLDADKTYRATLRLGRTTTTGDAEGELVEERTVDCSIEQVVAAAMRFQGEIEQVPPMYSALKHRGRALYDYARAGLEIERAPRRVCIHEIVIEAVELPLMILRARVSKGTYIRTLAEDIGAVLGCGAHLTALRRVDSGGLQLEDAVTLEELEVLDDAGRVSRLLAPDYLLLHLPALRLSAGAAVRFAHGNAVRVEHAPGEVRVYAPGFLGLAVVGEDAVLRAVRLVATAD